MAKSRDWRMDALAQVAFYAGLGVLIPAGMLAGYVVGRLADDYIHTTPILGMIGGLLGTAGGIVEVIRIVTRREKNAENSPEAD